MRFGGSRWAVGGGPAAGGGRPSGELVARVRESPCRSSARAFAGAHERYVEKSPQCSSAPRIGVTRERYGDPPLVFGAAPAVGYTRGRRAASWRSARALAERPISASSAAAPTAVPTTWGAGLERAGAGSEDLGVGCAFRPGVKGVPAG
jgi:hypothetical protein